MLAFIYHKTIWKYNMTNDDYNKIMVNNILNKNKSSGIFILYQKNTKDISNEQTYINKLYNLYQSIKLLINLTENENKDICAYDPIFLNAYYKRYKNLESQNKIKVKRLNKINRINDIQLDNSLSSIKKTIDLDERDNYQNGCLDFAFGNEMDYLLKNIQQSSNECLYNNYYRNCNIYRKKKSPQVSFRIFSPKNRLFFVENDLFDNQIKKNLINNNIYINNNNFNNHTNYFINDYNLNEKNKDNYDEKNLIIKRRYHHFGHFKSQTQTNILSSRICRNKLCIPQSQSCEKFVYQKKNISSKLKDKKLGNKTSEEFEEEKDENYMTDNENILSNAKYRAIPYMHKNTNVKILENLDENDEENKNTNCDKINYMGRNNFQSNNNLHNKNPFCLSKMTKNSKTNRKSNLTQDHYLTKFHSTFNLSLNYLSNIKEKPIKPNKSKIEKYRSNNNININDEKNKKDKNEKNEKNALNKLTDKKDKKVIKRKENQFKFKKNNTAKYNINSNKNDVLREKVLQFGKKNKKEKKFEKENKEFKKKVKNDKKDKPVNTLTQKRIKSPPLNKDNITQIIDHDQLTCKYRAKKISYKELLNNKFSNDFSNINKSNANINLNKFFTTKVKKKSLINNKSNNNINSISKQLFSPLKYDYYINSKKISFISNEKIIDTYYDINSLIYKDDNLNNSYFKTLPTKKEENEKSLALSKSENNKLIMNKIVSKKNKIKEIPIKVNLNKNSLSKINLIKSTNTNEKKKYNTEKTIESNKHLSSSKNNTIKRKINLERIAKKNNKKIRIDLYNVH